MAAGAMVTAAGAMFLLYYVLSRRQSAEEIGDEDRSGNFSKSSKLTRRRLSRRPAQAPSTWLESITMLSETLRFTYSETLGKWPIGDLAFGINYFIRRQGNFQVASVYAGSDCVQLRGPEIIAKLHYYLRLLSLCMLFSKKAFAVFIDSAGYCKEDVLLHKNKAGLLKPAFTIICDKNSKCLLLLIRGTHSMKDTLTAATGLVVPFQHSVLHDGGISNLVLGYAHCGMVAAARWIAMLSAPFLLKALGDNPDYRIQVVGHSLGGGTAALLTYILREQIELSSSTCITFAPAACMTWELAESGKHFITTIINGSDLVPTFSAASVDDLRSEVTASSWVNDLRDQLEQTRILNVVYRSATAVGSRLPSIATAKSKVASAGALLQPVSNRTQVVMKSAQNVAQAVVRSRSLLPSWSCMGARRRKGSMLNSKLDELPNESLIPEKPSGSTDVGVGRGIMQYKMESSCSSGGSGHDDTDEEEQQNLADGVTTTTTVEGINEGELWYELEKELQRQETEFGVKAQEEEAAVAQEITEEENMLVDAMESNKPVSSMDLSESHRFYPPGQIMHIVCLPSSDPDNLGNQPTDNEHVGIFETPRELYSKLRLSRTMINDHYMPMYKKMMELLIRDLKNDDHIYV